VATNLFGDSIIAGSTTVTIQVFLQDITTGNGLTNIVAGNTALSLWYTRPRVTGPVSITKVALGAPDSAFQAGGWIAYHNTNAPGLYRLDLPTGAVAAGADFVTVTVRVTGQQDPTWQRTFSLIESPYIETADALLNRDMAAGPDTIARSPRNAWRVLRNRTQVVGTTFTVYREDDAAAAWTGTVSTNPSADPVSGIDPA
jgi:hypothetical protein